MFSTFDLRLLLYVIRLAGWLKHCNLSLSLSVTISSPTTGITLEVDTTSPGLQFYSGGLLSVDTPVTGKAGVDYPQFVGGFAVETQVLKICWTRIK